jgi:hypothetical protein
MSKAQVRLTLTSIIYLVLALISLLLLLTLGARVISIFNSNQGSAVSFQRVSFGTELLLKHPDATDCHIPFSLEDDLALVGFDRGTSKLSRGGLIVSDITRPVECPHDKACLVLCNVGSVVNAADCQGTEQYDIKVFDDVSEFRFVEDFGSPGPLIYFGSGLLFSNDVEFFSIDRVGEEGNYVVSMYNRKDKLTRESKVCEALEDNKIKTLPGEDDD